MDTGEQIETEELARRIRKFRGRLRVVEICIALGFSGEAGGMSYRIIQHVCVTYRIPLRPSTQKLNRKQQLMQMADRAREALRREIALVHAKATRVPIDRRVVWSPS